MEDAVYNELYVPNSRAEAASGHLKTTHSALIQFEHLLESTKDFDIC
jgi:hypothetical protein